LFHANTPFQILDTQTPSLEKRIGQLAVSISFF